MVALPSRTGGIPHSHRTTTMQPATHSIERTSPPRTPRKKEFTLEDVRQRMDAQDEVIKGIRGDTLSQAGVIQRVELSMQSMATNMETMAKNMAVMAMAIGEEKEDGQGNYLGTGLLGRTRRVERAQRSLRELYHRWIAFGSGFCMCAGAFLLALWWLIGDKVAIVLKGTGH